VERSTVAPTRAGHGVVAVWREAEMTTGWRKDDVGGDKVGTEGDVRGSGEGEGGRVG